MFSDHTIAGTVSNLKEYYDTLYNKQQAAHGADYMLVHDEIKKRLKECNSYAELGVNQGATLATAILQDVNDVKAYDIDLTAYNYSAKFFETYASEHNIDYAIFETDTLACELKPVDVLYIDTKHYYDHLTKELARHGHKAQKFIIFHDTVMGKGLDRAVLEYVKNNSEWSVVTDCKVDVGFMTIGRK